MGLVARPLYQLGTLGLVAGVGWLHARFLAPEQYRFFGSPASRWWAVFALALVLAGYAAGLPELIRTRTGAAMRGFGATVAAFSLISAFQAVLATPLLPRSSSMLIGLTHPLLTVLAWNIARDTAAWAATRDRVFLVVERIEDRASLVADLADHPETPARIVGGLTLDDLREAGRGDEAMLEERVMATGANIVVLDAGAQAHQPTVEQAARLHKQGVRIRTLSLFYEEWIGKLPLAELARVSLLFDIGELHRVRYGRARRVVDLVFSAAGLMVLAPLVVVVAVVNPWLNPGPLLFRQSRVGQDGTTFEMFKLRTMVAGPPIETGGRAGGGGHWTTVDDPRITPLGRVLRRTHLDELPQVVNIARGDLSLVGPRPEQPHYVEELSDKIAFYDVRHIVRPGLTGWAQVKQGYAAGHGDAFEKLQFDFYYLRRQGLGLDARIIWRTLRGVIGGDGR